MIIISGAVASEELHASGTDSEALADPVVCS